MQRLGQRRGRLGLALILESHLGENRAAAFPKGLSALGKDKTARLAEMADGCYLCGKIEYHFSRMLDTAVLLYGEDVKFREKFAAQPYFCLPPYTRLLRLSLIHI